MNLKSLVFLIVTFFSVSSFAAGPKHSHDKTKININEATVEQLDDGLLGVGPRIAMEIVKHRDANGPFKSMDDLDEVKYVGDRMLDKNKGRIIFE
ncbi:ComEA family DNA-binding protein [Endozoicomonas ascidiicola]|uniref:ComEA family DNA-binding protein n=1 Tax=Endozoicomonas ascidiicola TaxID=1698521 RepID=UPI00082DADA7|nr:helix-hairpin-helix domain-containing protein [Endozoicomonas ascidiicola]